MCATCVVKVIFCQWWVKLIYHRFSFHFSAVQGFRVVRGHPAKLRVSATSIFVSSCHHYDSSWMATSQHGGTEVSGSFCLFIVIPSQNLNNILLVVVFLVFCYISSFSLNMMLTLNDFFIFIPVSVWQSILFVLLPSFQIKKEAFFEPLGSFSSSFLEKYSSGPQTGSPSNEPFKWKVITLKTTVSYSRCTVWFNGQGVFTAV